MISLRCCTLNGEVGNLSNATHKSRQSQNYKAKGASCNGLEYWGKLFSCKTWMSHACSKLLMISQRAHK